MSKKVLIMSASTGGGHNRAAKAMKEEIEKRCINGEYITCEIVDSLKRWIRLSLVDTKNLQNIHLRHGVGFIKFLMLILCLNMNLKEIYLIPCYLQD